MVSQEHTKVKLTPRIEGSKLGDRFIEFLALDAVLGHLEEHHWNWKVNKNRNEKGFDLMASKGEIEFKIEVKGRSLGEYSGIVNDSAKQKNDPQRFFNFSRAQYEAGDFFVSVFVSPLARKCVVVPKENFDILITSEKTPYRMAFSMDANQEIRKNKRWRSGRSVDISRYIEGWNLLDAQIE